MVFVVAFGVIALVFAFGAMVWMAADAWGE